MGIPILLARARLASLEAPGFVKMMPNAHNGYYDTILEMGYAGLAFLLVFIGATLHAVGRVATATLVGCGFSFHLLSFLSSIIFSKAYGCAASCPCG